MDYLKLRALLTRRFSIPKEYALRKLVRSLTIAERAVLYFFVVVFIISGTFLVWKVNNEFLIEVPTRGGTLVEGVIGNPRFINPVLAISEADKNLVALVYSGLVRITPEGGVVNDLADEVNVSDDRLIYTARIRGDARFHDGTPVTADDVIYTFQKIIDPTIKSPRRGNWEGVTIEKIDEETVAFTLKEVYTPFIYNLATGVLPKHIWKNVSADEFSFSQFNTFPVGSGIYKVERVERNSGGIPDYYELTPFEGIRSVKPYITKLIFRFYPNEASLIEAYNEHAIESLSGVSAENITELKKNGSRVVTSPLPRVFAVFFNQAQSKVLLNKEVRRALDLAAPKEEIVEDVLNGYGTPINGPLPAGILKDFTSEFATTSEVRLAEAQKILADAGWKMDEEAGVLKKKSGNANISLSFSISTGSAPELEAVAKRLQEAWEKLGAKVEVLTYETGDLNQNVIRPRNFDTLLFGEVVGRDADLYPFWHSSQRTDPGLNIASYANNHADKILENARSTSDRDKMGEYYKEFDNEIRNDMPAVFLYTPSFLYVIPKQINNVELGPLSVSQDRFLGIRDWYLETDKVWKIFY